MGGFRARIPHGAKPLSLRHCTVEEDDADGTARVSVEAAVLADNVERTIRGAGNGPIDAFAGGLNKAGFPFLITSYSEHALSIGSDSKAAANVRVERPERG